MTKLWTPPGARLEGHSELYYREDIENPEIEPVLVQTSRPGGEVMIGAPMSRAKAAFALPPMQGGAENFTNEGLARIINIFPRNAVAITDPLYMVLFTSQTASTVPAVTATGGASPSGWTEATGGGYARASIASTAWPATTTPGGVRTTMAAPGISFPESTGAYSVTAVNGFGICTHSSSQASDTTITFANFSDTTAVTVASAGYTIRVAAYWHLDN